MSEEKAEELERHSFVVGDIVVTKLGDPLGKAAIVPLKKGIIVADIVRIRLDPNFMDSKYLAYAINSPSVSKSLAVCRRGDEASGDGM